MDNEENKRWVDEIKASIRQNDPESSAKCAVWLTAIGLQGVDNLLPSPLLLEMAKRHIEGGIELSTVRERILHVYKSRENRDGTDEATREADLVSMRIAEILGENDFRFHPDHYLEIHRRLFQDIHRNPGGIRSHNLSKNEWILNGESVVYGEADAIPGTLVLDFERGKEFFRAKQPVAQSIPHITRFIADIWKIHPFAEGNTRTTAVFMIGYLKALGFPPNTAIFAEHSWYFRNALVRASYECPRSGISCTTVFLEHFLENMLLGTDHPLKNRFLHIDFGKSPPSTQPQLHQKKVSRWTRVWKGLIARVPFWRARKSPAEKDNRNR